MSTMEAYLIWWNAVAESARSGSLLAELLVGYVVMWHLVPARLRPGVATQQFVYGGLLWVFVFLEADLVGRVCLGGVLVLLYAMAMVRMRDNPKRVPPPPVSNSEEDEAIRAASAAWAISPGVVSDIMRINGGAFPHARFARDFLAVVNTHRDRYKTRAEMEHLRQAVVADALLRDADF